MNLKFSHLVLGAAFFTGLQMSAKHSVWPVPSIVKDADASSSGVSGPTDANIYVNLAKKVVPSVVNISTYTTLKGGAPHATPDDMLRRFFEDFFRNRGMPGGGGGGGGGGEDDEGDEGGGGGGGGGRNGPRAMSLGTGFIIEPGIILTNNHVVADAEEIKINFTEAEDEKPTDGEVIGRDTELDVALIKVKSDRASATVALGDSDALEVGEYVMAVGNPFGQGHSVTHGIISAKGRIAPDFRLASYLQTDAPINPGNSGGPLVNLKGEVIGINNAIDQRAQGIGFAIPINLVKKILPQLKTQGSVSRGYIGVLVGEMTPDLAEKLKVSKDLRAPFITNVYKSEPAEKAGAKTYDVILEFGGKAIHSSGDLINAVVAVPIGETVPMKVSRSGKEMTLQVKVAKRPGSQPVSTKDKNAKKKKEKKRPNIDLGMTVEDISPEIARDLGIAENSTGVVVTQVGYDGPADRAELARGDIIVDVDQKPVKDVDSFYARIKEKKTYMLRVRRVDAQGKDAFTVVVLNLKDQPKDDAKE